MSKRIRNEQVMLAIGEHESILRKEHSGVAAYIKELVGG